MTGTFGLLIELTVVGLLIVTISYCALLDKRLRAVRQDEQVMRKTVVDLSAATERAERAIESLRHTLGDCDRTLAERLRVAERYTADLEDQIRSGDDVLSRITRIVANTQEQPAHEPPTYAHQQRVYAQQPSSAPAPTPAPPSVAAKTSRISQTLAAARNLAAHASARLQEPRDAHQPNQQPYNSLNQRDYVA